MFNRLVVFATLAVAVGIAGTAGTAHAQGVTFDPFGVGGAQWTVTAPAFTTPFSYGTRTANMYSVPYAVNTRAGCFVAAPPLRVGHRDGQGFFIPDFYSTWEAIIRRSQSPSATVFTLQVEIIAPSGAVTSTQRKPVSSGQYNPQPIYFPNGPNGDTALYWGELDSSLTSINVLQNFDVREGDQIRVSVCDLAPESTIDVRKLILQTLPRQ